MAPLMVMPPSSAKPVLVLSFDFGLIGSEPSLVEIGESMILPHFSDHQQAPKMLVGIS